METPMKQLIEEALKNINSVADVNTVIGEPVTLPNGVTVVPFSKVIGAEGNVTLLDLKNPDSYTPKQNPIEKILDSANSLMDRAPDMIAKCKDAFGKKQETQESEETEEN